MAQDPVYKRASIYDLETPKLNLDTYQQAVGSSRQLEAALDKLTGVAVKKSGEAAAERGKQYGIDNPVSVDQLLEGAKGGEIPPDLFVQDTTIFGKNAKKYQAKIARVDLEYRARKEFQEIALQVDAGLITTREQLETSINGVIQGFGNTLNQFDADEALSMNASISQAGRAVAGSALSTLVKNFDAANIAEAEDYVNNIYVDELTSQLNEMDIKDPTVFEAFINSDELAVTNKVNSIINPAERAKLKKIQIEKKRTVVHTAIAKHFMDRLDPEVGYADAIRQIDNGEAGEWTAFLNDSEFVGVSGKESIKDQIKTKFDQMETALKSAQEKQKREVIDQATDLEYTFLYSDDPTAVENAEKALKDLANNPHYGYKSFEALKDKNIKIEDAKIKTTAGYSNIMLQLNNGDIVTTDGLEAAGKSIGLDKETTYRIFGKALTNNEYRRTQAAIKDLTKIGWNKGEGKDDEALRYASMETKVNKILIANTEFNKANPDQPPKPTSMNVIKQQIINSERVVKAEQVRQKKLDAFLRTATQVPEVATLLESYENDFILSMAYDNSELMVRIDELIASNPKYSSYVAPLVKTNFKNLKTAIEEYKQAVIDAEIDE